MANPEILVEIGATIEGLKKTLLDAEGKLKKFGDQATKIGQTLSLSLTAPLTVFAGLTLRTFASFEASLNKASAITGATGNELEKLSNKARELGSTTQFSASQAADAITFLGQAGFSTTKIVDSLDDTLKLAAASGLDLGRSADIVSNVLSGFQLETSELNKTVDLLSKAFTTSNQDLNQLAEAIKFAGPTATSLGVSISETVAAIGALSDSGIQASSAGTGLRRVLATLAKDAKKLGIETFDASGKLKPLADIIGLIEERGLSGTEALEIFGLQGGPIIETLLARGSSALREYSEALEDAGGTADRLAKAQTAGLAGALKTLNSAFEELQLRIAESGLAGAFEKLINKLTSVIIAFSKLDETTLNIIVGISAIVAAIGPLLVGLGALLKILPLLATGFAALTGPIGLIALAVSAATIGIISLNAELEKTAKISGIVKDAQLEENFKNLGNEVNKLAEDFKKIDPNLTNVEAFNKALDVTIDSYSKLFVTQFKAGNLNADLLKQQISFLEGLRKKTDEATVTVVSLKQSFEEFSALADIANIKVFEQFDKDATEFNNTLKETISLQQRISDLASGVVSTFSKEIIDVDTKVDGPPVIEIPDIDESSKSRFLESLKGFNEEASKILEVGIENTIGDFAFSIGDALASGGNVLKAAGGALLGGIAAILNQLGQLAIATGVTIKSIKEALLTLNPVVAIGAGVALVALAGFVSSKAKSLGGGGFSGGGGGMGGGGGGGMGAGSSFTGSGGMAFAGSRDINLMGSFRIDGNDLLYVIDRTKEGRI